MRVSTLYTGPSSHFIALFPRHISLFFSLFSDRLEGDEDEPDLPLLSTLDFAALKDIRQTGEEYCRSFTKLLHETPGLQPGYLPQPDALYLLSGVSINLSIFFDYNIF